MFTLKFTVTVLKLKCYSIVQKRFVSSKVRVRFAPSPTGYLHLGGLRTALFNHLYAKSLNGEAILRIEDTDLSRKVPLAAESIIEDLAWCGIKYEEGPYFQSERKEIYQKYAEQLIKQGDAYYCFCSPTRLNLIKKEAIKAREIPKYDNHCCYLTKEEIENNLKTRSSCIRFKLANTKYTFNDLVLGPTDNCDLTAQEGDFVILKSDGFPTYHFANVVDDHLMNITHVLRGTEWLVSTSKHMMLYRAFRWDPPMFGHLPLLMNNDGTKLSKRHGHLNIKILRDNGILPNSLINFIVRIGGGCDIKTEKNLTIYTFEELVEKFDLSKIKVSSSKVNTDTLLLYNHAEILRQFESTKERPNLVKKVKEIIQKKFEKNVGNNKFLIEDKRVESILEVLKHRILHLEDVINQDFHYLWHWENKWDETNKIYNEIIKSVIVKIEEVNWTLEDLKTFLQVFCSSFENFKYSDVMLALRLALTGRKVGHSVTEIMYTLSKEVVLFRLSQILENPSQAPTKINNQLASE